ncbi:MAG: diguanylate cyclase [Planctomycetes bacterium]|nr:diguanylate cyclase [Planctomycetota bacterium]
MTSPAKLSSLRFEDDLTGLHNSRALPLLLHSMLLDGDGRKDGSLVFLELHDFEAMRKQLGQSTLSRILAQFAERLRGVCRPGDLAGRLRADTFYLLCPGLEKKGAMDLAERVKLLLCTHPLRHPRSHAPVEISASSGLATFPEDGRTPEAVIETAGRALFVGGRPAADRSAVVVRETLAGLAPPEFIGRVAEFDAFQAVIEDIRRGGPVLALVQGEAGVGKSRFLRECVGRAARAGVASLYYAGSRAVKRVEGYPLLCLLDACFEDDREALEDLRGRLSAAERLVLGERVPAFSWLREERPVEPPEKVAMSQAIASALHVLARRNPVLLMLDHAEDADRTTLEVVRALSVRADGAVGIIVAFRGDVRGVDPDCDGALIDTLAEFDKLHGVRMLGLAPLHRAELLRMIASILPGVALPPRFAEILADVSRGNPLYVEAILRSLVEKGRIRRDEHGWEVAPLRCTEPASSLNAAVFGRGRVERDEGDVLLTARAVSTIEPPCAIASDAPASPATVAPPAPASGTPPIEDRRGGAPESMPSHRRGLRQACELVQWMVRILDSAKKQEPGCIDEALISGLRSAAAALLGEVPTVTYAVLENEVRINGEKPRQEESAGLRAFFETHKLRVLTLLPGVEAWELEAFVGKLLRAASRPPWLDRDSGVSLNGLLRAEEVPHVTIEIESSDKPKSPTTSRPTTRIPAPQSSLRIDDRAGAWLEAPLEEFLSEAKERSFGKMLEALSFAGFQKIADQLEVRLGEAFGAAQPETRGQALKIANCTLRSSSQEVHDRLLNYLNEPLHKALQAEQDSAVLGVLEDVVCAWCEAQLARSRISVVAWMLWKSVRPRLQSFDTPRAFRISLTAKLKGLVDQGPHNPMELLKKGPAGLRQEAARIMTVIGEAYAAPLTEMIAGSDDGELNHVAVAILKEIGDSGATALGRLVRSDGPADVARRVLGVLELAGGNAIMTAVLAAVAHPDPTVRDAAFALLRRMDREAALPVWRRMLTAQEAPGLLVTVLAMARQQGLAELVPDVIRTAGTVEDDTHMHAICEFLGEFPAPAAVPVLKSVFERKVKVFGLVKGFTECTRAAAIEAATKIRDPSAQELLTSAQSDKGDTIRRVLERGKDRETRLRLRPTLPAPAPEDDLKRAIREVKSPEGAG